jgi:hypothetical protein
MKGQGQSAEFFDFGAKKDRGNPADEPGFYPAGVVLEVSRFTSREKFKASGLGITAASSIFVLWT